MLDATRPQRVTDPDGKTVEVFPLPTDENSLEALLRELFVDSWADITFGPIVQGAAWEMQAPHAPSYRLLILRKELTRVRASRAEEEIRALLERARSEGAVVFVCERELKKQRLQPANHWDWGIPGNNFTQGWKIGKLAFIGGQISADANAKAVGNGDMAAKTRNFFNFIRVRPHHGPRAHLQRCTQQFVVQRGRKNDRVPAPSFVDRQHN